jgi:hypothetical protein
MNRSAVCGRFESVHREQAGEVVMALRTRSELAALEPPHRPFVVPGRLCNHLRRNLAQRADQIVEFGIVVFDVPLPLLDHPGVVLVEFVPFLADVLDPGRDDREIAQ